MLYCVKTRGRRERRNFTEVKDGKFAERRI